MLVVACSLQWGRRRTSTESGRGRAAWSRGAAGFNGAVDERRRRGRRAAISRIVGACFNGAVDERRRRGTAAGPEHEFVVAASMGPSTNVDGELVVGERRWRAAKLQWGRRRSSTESEPYAAESAPALSLQWGRRRTSTER